jgi:hypothetical protein
MGFISDTARKVVFWNYSRTSWQWDVLCVLILAFIFLTPKSWFINHPPIRTGVCFASDLVGKQEDADIERCVREKLKEPNGERVGKIRPRPDASGRVIAYEVDIR